MLNENERAWITRNTGYTKSTADTVELEVPVTTNVVTIKISKPEEKSPCNKIIHANISRVSSVFGLAKCKVAGTETQVPAPGGKDDARNKSCKAMNYAK